MEDTSPGTETTSAPASFAEAAATLEASSASAPATTAPASETTAPAATTQADAETTAAASATSGTEPKGEPPQWRWQDIKENLRKKTAEETEARVRQEYEARLAAFNGMDPSELQGFRVMQAALAGDQRAIAQIKQVPQALQALRAMVAEQQASTDAEPEPDLETTDGAPVYSAARLKQWQEWHGRQLTASFDQRMQATLQPVQSIVQAHQHATVKAEVANVVAQFTTDPDFVKHKADVRAAINEDAKLAELADRDPHMALELAWNRVRREKVEPQLSQKERASVLADIHHKTTATTVNPGHTTISLPKRPRDFFEAAQMLEAGGR